MTRMLFTPMLVVDDFSPNHPLVEMIEPIQTKQRILSSVLNFNYRDPRWSLLDLLNFRIKGEARRWRQSPPHAGTVQIFHSRNLFPMNICGEPCEVNLPTTHDDINFRLSVARVIAPYNLYWSNIMYFSCLTRPASDDDSGASPSRAFSSANLNDKKASARLNLRAIE